jgi:tubulysin polyketide synthase-like protein
MTATILLAELYLQGASVSASGGRLRVEAPPGVLTASTREALATQKADILPLLPAVEEYCVLLRSDMDGSVFLDAQARLIDELGPGLATVIRQAVARGAAAGLRHA